MPSLFKPKKSACDKLILASTLAMGKRELGSCGSDNNNQIGDDANDHTLQDFDDNIVKFWHKETLAVAPHNRLDAMFWQQEAVLAINSNNTAKIDKNADNSYGDQSD
ncbi:hypothetical protein GcC1_039027 [Golovinomyces cichoracearum]|uniref:Uncharacterized protein n=1 Tax=Golovinomyces cichoracearum TaxID=62708 RepID=A0A420J062_9PEZI|nr:hypothetical protein GcC1_039027 [Golovinomyces cichoracearum]